MLASTIVGPADFEIQSFPEFYDRTTRTNFVLDVTSSRVLALHDNVLLAIHFLKEMDEKSAHDSLQKRGLPSEVASESLRLVAELVRKGHLQPRTRETRSTPPKHRHIGFMNLNLAHDCNLACRYCFASAGTYQAIGGEGLMNWDVSKGAIDLLRTQNLSLYHIGLFGGEPLLNKPVIARVIPYAKQTLPNVTFMLSTNGTLLDEDLIDLFSSNGVEIQISCDGGKRLQDRLRPGRPDVDSYKGVTNAVVLLKKKGVRTYHARATATNLLPSHNEILLQLMAIGFERVGCQPVSGDPSLALNPEDTDRYCSDIRSLVRSGSVSAASSIASVLSKVQRASHYNWFCSAGYNGVTVTPDGSLFPCHRMIQPEYRIGDVWTGVDSARLGELYPDHSVDDHEPCSSCWARYFCGGGCYAENTLSTGSNWKPWPTRCRILRTTLEAVIEYHLVEPTKKGIQNAARGAGNEAAAAQT